MSFYTAGTSTFLNLDKTDMIHLAKEAGLTGALGVVTVVAAYASGHDLGTAAPIVIWLLGMLTSAIKKALTDNTPAK